MLASYGAKMIVHAEDSTAIERAPAPHGRHYSDFLASRPRGSENVAIAHLIEAARHTGASVHLLHLSSSDAVPMLRTARREGIRMTVETCPHYLSFEAEAIADGATQFKCCPPIREIGNREELWHALARGDIDCVVSDHSPCTAELKRLDVGEFDAAWGGISSLQIGLPAVWTEARLRGHTLVDVVRWMAQRPAEIARLQHKGRIERGYHADFAVFAPGRRVRRRPDAAAPPQPRHPVRAARARRRRPQHLAARPPGHRRRTAGDVDQPRRGVMSTYYSPTGGLPPQTQLLTDRAMFREAYAVIPRGTNSDIVTSFLPFWNDTRLWVLARPLTGFAETFSQYMVEVAPGGGSERPELDPEAEGVVFLTAGLLHITLDATAHKLEPGGYAYIPPGADWTVRNEGGENAHFHWIRKAYERVEGLDVPEAFVTNERDVEAGSMPDTDGRWRTTRFVDPADLRHDMHVNIVTFEPGTVIPFAETHVMEHGLYVLEGKAVYRLNEDWVEVQEGDFMWLRAFCPQACYAGGPGRFRYLLYKDVNRHMKLNSRIG